LLKVTLRFSGCEGHLLDIRVSDRTARARESPGLYYLVEGVVDEDGIKVKNVLAAVQ
jgi:hypothetical protein